MGRPKTRYEYEIPGAVVEIVRGICADYERRENAIKHSNITGSTLERYLEFNTAIDFALSLCDVRVREYLVSDIAEERGYAFSQCSLDIAKNTYYENKRKFIYHVARKLSLIP